MTQHKNTYHQALIETPLGPMLAIADENSLYLLEFTDRRGLEKELDRFKRKINSTIIPGYTKPIASIENELKKFFESSLQNFETPIALLGTPFQNDVWRQLLKIPTGETRSYSDVATTLKKTSASRAVAQAIGANQLAIIIPCHRVINANGALGGYAGGLTRKEWLLRHETQNNRYKNPI